MEQVKTPNIYEMQKNYNILLAQVQLCTRMAYELQKTAESPKIPQLDKICVQGRGKKRDMGDTIIPIIDWEQKGKELEKQLDIYKATITEMEKIYKDFKDRDSLLYLYVKLKGYSCIKAGMMVKPSISDRWVRKIIQEIDEKFEKVPFCS